MADAERTIFADEAAARQVEALSSNAEIIAYLQGAQSRYEAAAQPFWADLPMDASARDWLKGFMVATGIVGFTDSYSKRQNAEIDAFWDEVAPGSNHQMQMGLLRDMSRDDAECRAMLTELIDLQAAMIKVRDQYDLSQP